MAIIDNIEIYQDWTEDGYKFKKDAKKPDGIDFTTWIEPFLESEYHSAKPAYATPEEADAYIHGQIPADEKTAKHVKKVQELARQYGGHSLLTLCDQHPSIHPTLKYVWRIERKDGALVIITGCDPS